MGTSVGLRLRPSGHCGAIARLLGLAVVRVEDQDAVAEALRGYEAGLDFADALHRSSSVPTAAEFATFDLVSAKKAPRGEGAVRVRQLDARPIPGRGVGMYPDRAQKVRCTCGRPAHPCPSATSTDASASHMARSRDSSSVAGPGRRRQLLCRARFVRGPRQHPFYGSRFTTQSRSDTLVLNPPEFLDESRQTFRTPQPPYTKSLG